MVKLNSNSQWLAAILIFGFGIVGCSGSLGGDSVTGTSLREIAECPNLGTTQTTCPAAAANVIPITVGGTLSGSYQNEPVVSVKVCSPGSAVNCKTIDNILLDTGSYGLRIFNSALSSLGLTTVKYSGKELAECVVFGTGSMWGPIKQADVYLGGEPVLSSMSIQAVDTSYYTSSIPKTTPDCSDSDYDPNISGYNGIMGVGGTQYDTNWANYYSCASGSCSAVSIGNMSPTLQNPVYALTATTSSDGNGLAIILPPLTAAGAGIATGCLVLGIGTQSNNAANSVTVLPATSTWTFRTIFNGTLYSNSFIDSGTNSYAIPATSGLPTCSGTGDIKYFYCPTTTQCLSATQKGKLGSLASTTVNFAVANTNDLLSSGNFNFKNMAFTDTNVDWGLPFFFGRVVYVGNDGQNSTVNGVTSTGPFWAY